MDEKDWIAGAAKALAIIEAFDEEHARMTPTMVAARAGLSRTAARRYLLTLRELGYVDTDGKLFWLAPRVLRLGQSYLDSARLPRTVQPFLQRITATVQETALVAILDEHDVVYVARNGVNRAMAVGFVLGSRASAPLSSAGLILLAFQPPESIEQWLASYPIKVFTPHSIRPRSACAKCWVKSAAMVMSSPINNWSWACAALRCRCVTGMARSWRRSA